MDKEKLIQSIISCVIIGMFLLICSIIIASSLRGTQENQRYELTTHGNHIIIFDKETGDYYEKFIPSNQAPTNWYLEENPFLSKK